MALEVVVVVSRDVTRRDDVKGSILCKHCQLTAYLRPDDTYLMRLHDNLRQQSEILDRLAQLVRIFDKEPIRHLGLRSRCSNRLSCCVAAVGGTKIACDVPLFDNVVDIAKARVVESELNTNTAGQTKFRRINRDWLLTFCSSYRPSRILPHKSSNLFLSTT